MTIHSEFEELIPLYALGNLDDPDRRSVETHLLSGCSSCKAELSRMDRTASVLAALLVPVEPPQRAYARIRRRVVSDVAGRPDDRLEQRHREFEALLPLYAFGALGANERDAFEAHLAAGCLECERTLARQESIAADVAMSRPAAVPPARIGRMLKAWVHADVVATRAGTPAAEAQSSGAHAPVPAAAMVGREAELSAISGRLREVARGEGSFVAVEAESGLGKSRLIEEATAPAHTVGLTLAVGHCVATEAKPSFEPFVEVLREWAGIEREDAAEGQVEALERMCANLLGAEGRVEVPALARMLGLDPGPRYERDLSGIEGAALEKRIHQAVEAVITAKTRRAPVVLVLEDLHWADQSTLALLESLLPLIDSNALLILSVSRPGYPDTSGRILRFAHAHHRMRLHPIALAPLDERATLVLARTLLGASKLPHEVADLIRSKADGNPFYVEEITRSLLRSGAVVVDRGNVTVTGELAGIATTNTIEQVVMSRVERLDEAARLALETASIIGRQLHRAVLERMLPAGLDAEVILARLHSERFLRAKASRSTSTRKIARLAAEPVLVFEHALMQEILHDSLDEGRRRELHYCCAQAIEAAFPQRLYEFYGMLAYHYTCARAWGEASRYLWKAGELAAESAASAEALYFFREAHRIFKMTHGEGADRDVEARLERNVAIALLNTGNLAESIEHFNSALRLYGEWVPSNGAPTYLKFAVDMPAVLLGLYTGRFGKDKPACDERDRALFELMYNRCRAQNIADHERRVFDNIAAIRHVGHLDPSSVDNAAGILASAGAFFAFSGLSFGPSHRFLALAGRLAREGSEIDRFLYKAMAFVVHFLEGDWSGEHDIDAQAFEHGLRCGLLWDADVYLGLNCERNIHQGNYEIAAEQTAKFHEMADRWGYEFANSNAYGTRAHLLVAQRRLEEAREAAQRWHDLRDEDQIHVLSLGMLAKIECLLGQRDDAARTLARLEDLRARTSGISFPFYSGAYRTARLLLDLEEIEARAAAGGVPDRALARRARKSCRAALASACKIARDTTETLRMAARVYWLLAKPARAYSLWTQAIATGQRLGERAELGRVYRDLWRSLQSSEARVAFQGLQAADWLARANETFTALGLERELEQTAHLRDASVKAA